MGRPWMALASRLRLFNEFLYRRCVLFIGWRSMLHSAVRCFDLYSVAVSGRTAEWALFVDRVTRSRSSVCLGCERHSFVSHWFRAFPWILFRSIDRRFPRSIGGVLSMNMRPNLDTAETEMSVKGRGGRSLVAAAFCALINALFWVLIGSLYFGAGAPMLTVVGGVIFAISLFGMCLIGGSLGEA